MTKRKIIFALVIGTIASGAIFVYMNYQDKTNNKAEDIYSGSHDKDGGSDIYTGSYDLGNYIYGAAMNLAWNEMTENLVHETPKFNTQDPDALGLISKFNSAPFTAKDLDEKSYYVKSGFGQETVTAINQESKQKFPTKSFSDLDLKLAPEDFIAYAYFLKEVEYLEPFKMADVTFNDEQVKGFLADRTEQKANIQILNYTDQDRFIVKIKLKDDSDEIFMAKGFDMDNPDYVVSKLNESNKNTLDSLGKDDIFKMPEVHLDYKRDYDQLVNLSFQNKGFEDYYIRTMFEKIKFDINNKGARVENEGVIAVGWGSVREEESMERKLIILDKPFWIVMKRTDSQRPYFILGVNNSSILEK